MNGFGQPPPSPSPATAASASISHHAGNAPNHLTSANATSKPTVSVAPSPFSTPSVQHHAGLSNPNGGLPLPKTPYNHPARTPPLDSASITGKRKRADSSPVKEPQNASGTVPPAHRQQLLSTLRRNFLSTLTEYDVGISLLDRPVALDSSSHEAKKSKVQPAPSGLETLRQRIASDTFYTSLPPILKDVNTVVNEASEGLGAPVGVAPEDEMKDDDGVPVKNEAGDTIARIQKFKQVAMGLISQAATQYPFLNVSEEEKAVDTESAESDGSPFRAQRPYKFALSIVGNSGNRMYSIIHSPRTGRTGARQKKLEDIDVDQVSDERMLREMALPVHAQVVKIYQAEAEAAFRKPFTVKDMLPAHAKTSSPRRDKKAAESKTSPKGLETTQWLYYGPFASFAPTSDEGNAVISLQEKNRLWYSMHGEEALRQVRSSGKETEDEDAEFKKMADSYEPIPIDPALFESESESDKALREMSDLLVDLRIRQATRASKPNQSQQPKVDAAETEAYQKALARLTDLVGKLDPESFDKIDSLLDSVPDSRSNLPAVRFPIQGSAPNPEKAPQPASAPTPGPQYTTTRVSYAGYGGDGAFSPSARVVSNRPSSQNQYTRSSGYSQQHYPPQTPVNRQSYSHNPSYYTPQPQYTQQRQAVPSTPQFPPGNYANSPFSRSSQSAVPRIAAAGGQQVYIHAGSGSYQQPAIRQTTGYITQNTSQGPMQVQTGRRVSMVPQTPQPQPQQSQQPHRPQSGQGYHYTSSHNYQVAQQTQQHIIMRQQQQQQQQQPHPQYHQPGTPNQGQYVYAQQSMRHAMTPNQPRIIYANGYQPPSRMMQGPPPAEATK
ncbi:hypothetical protein TWF696_006259 [Orbilia brochopaga]